jgi:alpha-glucosidase (family GH31 glycosyl hydrolase)
VPAAATASGVTRLSFMASPRVPSLLILASAVLSAEARAVVPRKTFSASGARVTIEVLDDDLIHVEASAAIGPAPTGPLYTSPMVYQTDYAGPSAFVDSGNTFETSSLRVEVNPATLELRFLDKTQGNAELTRVRALDLGQGLKRLQIEPGTMRHVYGLGQRFLQNHGALGPSDGDWTALGVRDGSGTLGNGFEGFPDNSVGMVGNVQIPVMYALGASTLAYALFFDNVYKQTWRFDQSPWQVSAFGDQLRFYVMQGPSLLDLRKDYLELTGMPPVPPRKALGLWVSEFGYDNWHQLHELRDGLRASGFPLDGFVLDLNWFGGVVPNHPARSRMGQLDWDQTALDGNPYYFPNPSAEIAAFIAEHIDIAAIEESYVAAPTSTHAQMPAKLMAYQRVNAQCVTGNQGTAVEIDASDFFGKARMIDWSDPAAGVFIHEQRRYPNLVQRGINVHWTDLGEPERFDSNACYEGVETANGDLKNKHPDIHNLYNLLWNRSIWDGYASKQGQADALGRKNRRPLILTRSGAAGTQRYGAAMWSGDIGSNLPSLGLHLNAQLHMAFSGIDYYGSDVGGFRRERMPGNNDDGAYRGYEEELYTEWFANAAWFDIPLRPHTDNEFKDVFPPYPTSPDRVGKRPSNLANVRQRYELIPYYYSLAYRAFLEGEPVIAPLVMYYPADQNVRRTGHEKLIGRDILVGVVAEHGEYARNVYLPEGSWVDYHTGEWVHAPAQGVSVQSAPAYRGGLFQLPAYVRAGALLPQMFVDADTLDATGARKAGATAHGELIVRAYAGNGSFTLYEDDGETLGYDASSRPRYVHRTTLLQQTVVSPTLVRISVGPASLVGGTSIPGLAGARRNLVRLTVDNQVAVAVSRNGSPLTQHSSAAAFEAANSGWRSSGPNTIEAKSPAHTVTAGDVFEFSLQPAPVRSSVLFACDNGGTQFGERIYASGTISDLGNSNPAQAIELSPDIYYEYIWHPPPSPHPPLPGPKQPTWTGVVAGLPPSTSFQWRCVRRKEDGTGTPVLGALQSFTTAASGYSGRALGTL